MLACSGLDTVEARITLDRLMRVLSQRERIIIEMHYGLAGERLTLGEIGQQLGLGAERIREIEHRALRTMRRIPERNLYKRLGPLAVQAARRAGMI
jgi:RNA polymerase sigma factor (sigma-70 family)